MSDLFYCDALGLSTLVTASSDKWHQGTGAPPLPCEQLQCLQRWPCTFTWEVTPLAERY